MRTRSSSAKQSSARRGHFLEADEVHMFWHAVCCDAETQMDNSVFAKSYPYSANPCYTDARASLRVWQRTQGVGAPGSSAPEGSQMRGLMVVFKFVVVVVLLVLVVGNNSCSNVTE